MEKLREIPFAEYKDGLFRRLADKSRVARLSREEWNQYNNDLKWARDYNAEMDYVKGESYNKGRAEGVAEGRAEGRTEGLLDIAKAMKAGGETVEKIMLYTNLSLEQIENL